MDIANISGSDLIRDLGSGAILNPNRSDYEIFIEKKLKEKKTNEKITDLESRVKELQDIVSSYSSMFELAKDVLRKNPNK